MSTPDEFLSRVFAAADDAALALACTSPARQEEWLQGFARRVRAHWGEIFAPYFSESDVDGVVADLVGRVRAKTGRLERFGRGTA
jgi:hypothetical protein